MIVNFEKEYLRELYEMGKTKNKKHSYQPYIINKYGKIIDIFHDAVNVLELMKYPSLHYKRLQGNKEGLSSVRVNDQYRVEFREILKEGETIAEICNITELSNHYK